MNHEEVVEKVKEYLSKKQWIIKEVPTTEVTPDIVAIKPPVGIELVTNESQVTVLTVEAKPEDASLRELMTGIGQCVSHVGYPSDRVYLALPERRVKDVIQYARLVGFIGILAVKKNGEVSEVLPAKQTPKILAKDIAKERRTTLLTKLVFVRDIIPEELGRILVFLNENVGKYSNRKEFLDLLYQNFDRVSITHEGRPRRLEPKAKKYFVYRNYPIAFSHLGLWDNNANLTGEGMKLLHYFTTEKDRFLMRVAWLLFTYGNWLDLLKFINHVQIELRDKKVKKNEFEEILAKKLYDHKFSVSVEAMLRDLRDEFDWLKDLKVIKGWNRERGEFEIDWNRILDILTMGSKL